jgi:uncharacterized paraquat-inducible protein A
MDLERLHMQDWLIRTATVVVIGGFMLGWILKRFTPSGRAATQQAAAEEAAAIRCDKCRYYLVSQDTSCPKCGHPVAVETKP